MNTLYLDIFSGISGDMLLGALIDLGVDPEYLEAELKKLELTGYHLHVSRQSRSGIEGTKFDVHLDPPGPYADSHDPSEQPTHGHAHSHSHSHSHAHAHDHPHSHSHSHEHSHAVSQHEGDHGHGRTFDEIRDVIQRSAFSDWLKQKAVALFHRIAVAEGKIHGQPPEKVHFHEVGALDSIIDIVGGCLALERLGKPRVLAAPVVEGRGWIDCAHGRFPVPSTATLEILGARGIAVSQCDEPHELVTPTGAAFLAEFAEAFTPMQDLVAEKVGYGVGTRHTQTRPNVLRAVLTESRQQAESTQPDWERDKVAQLETNLDDLHAEILGYFIDQALAAGALDVFYTPIQMKKNRPGVLLSLLCPADQADRFTEMILRETSAFGVRRSVWERRKLPREGVTVKTPYGEIKMKLGKLSGATVQVTPEFESCKARAEAAQVPLKQIYDAALKAYYSQS